MAFNLDVNEIVNQIANGVGVAAETLIDLYPQLVTEIVRYEFFGSMEALFGGLSIVFGVVAFPVLLISSATEDWVTKNVVISAIVCELLLIIISIVMYALQMFTAPNVVLFMKLLNLT